MEFNKKSDWGNTTLPHKLAAELQRMDDGIAAIAAEITITVIPTPSSLDDLINYPFESGCTYQIALNPGCYIPSGDYIISDYTKGVGGSPDKITFYNETTSRRYSHYLLKGSKPQIIQIPIDSEASGNYYQNSDIEGVFAEIGDKLTNLGTSLPAPTSWADVQAIVRAGKAKEVFSIGEQLVCNHAELGTVIWDIIGIDEDTPSDSNYTHSLTLQMHEVLMEMEEDNGQNSNQSGKWSDSLCPIRDYLNSEGFLSKFDTDFTNVLGQVKKYVVTRYNDNSRDEEKYHMGIKYYTTIDTMMFLLSLSECGAVNPRTKTNSDDTTLLEGVAYSYYSDVITGAHPRSSEVVRIKYNRSGEPVPYWLRTYYGSDDETMAFITAQGAYDDTYYSVKGVVPACCIW